MRPAEVAGYFEALHRSPVRPVALRKCMYRGVAGLADETVEFTSPLTAICGPNGAGKTAALRAIWAALDSASAATRPDLMRRLSGAEISIDITSGGTARNLTCNVNDVEITGALAEEINVVHLDSSGLAAGLQTRLCEFGDFDELLDAYGPTEANANELRMISYVCKKDYKSVVTYEIDEFDDLIPFMVVKESGVTYDSRTMSLGELSLLILYWTLQRAEEGSVILLEEPETYISPASQRSLVEYLAKLSVTRKLWILMTTHSSQIISPLSDSQIKYMYRSDKGAEFASPDQYPILRRAIGLNTAVDRLVLVEDRAAREFSKLLIGRQDNHLATCSEIIDLGGEGAITNARRSIPRNMRALSVIGLYDGDMRGKIPEIDRDDTWPATCLPGANGVEALFRGVAGQSVDRLGHHLGREVRELKAILAGLQGLDDHAWLESFAASLRMDFKQVMHACFETWYAQPGAAQAAGECVAEITSKTVRRM